MREYWQKKPLLIRQAIPDFEPPMMVINRGLASRRAQARGSFSERGTTIDRGRKDRTIRRRRFNVVTGRQTLEFDQRRARRAGSAAGTCWNCSTVFSWRISDFQATSPRMVVAWDRIDHFDVFFFKQRKNFGQWLITKSTGPITTAR